LRPLLQTVWLRRTPGRASITTSARASPRLWRDNALVVAATRKVALACVSDNNTQTISWFGLVHGWTAFAGFISCVSPWFSFCIMVATLVRFAVQFAASWRVRERIAAHLLDGMDSSRTCCMPPLHARLSPPRLSTLHFLLLSLHSFRAALRTVCGSAMRARKHITRFLVALRLSLSASLPAGAHLPLAFLWFTPL